ncbi:MAG: pyridoxal phosphate-dependent aminotransferase [Calditrichaeota bacterium]|nr:pyridoxal phosphate-dependent aminotransferase [Calditrichota bacterium]
MRFGVIDLLDWLKEQPEDVIDISRSGVAGPSSLSDLGLDITDLPLGGPNVYGWRPLRELLASRFGVAFEQVAITPGASGGNFGVIAALCGSGDRVVLERPCYRPFPAVIEAVTGQAPIYFERKPSERYRLPSAEVLPAGQMTLAVITNLHNPSGVASEESDITALAEGVAARGGYLLVDEIFRPFLAGQEWLTSARLQDRIIATGSLTKAWGLGGLRIGWVIASREVVWRVQRAFDYAHVVQPFATEYIAWKILNEDARSSQLLAAARRRAAVHLPIIKSSLDSTGLFDYVTPDGGIVIFARLKGGGDAGPLAERLLRTYHVLVQPGHFFGDPTAIRIGFGCDHATLERGLQAIREVCADLVSS